MRIAIITFSDFNTNYGSMLQAFSLKIYLESLGHSVTFIRYREYNTPSVKSVRQKVVNHAKGMVLNTYRLVKRKDILQTQSNFEKFKRTYFHYTPLYASSDEMRHKMETFDCYICGSDQIWNLNCLGGLRTPYFLDFAPEKSIKFSYAASMGEYHVTSDLQTKISELLNGLNYISVREADRVAEVQSLTKNEVVNVVDPVFLNSKMEWERWLPNSPIKGEYAVCYFVRRSKFGEKVVEIMSQRYDMPIYNLSDNMIYLRGTSSKYISAGPLEFLSILKNAKYAVGTSFHLAAFSIIFGVPILAIGMESNRSRIQNILDLAGIKEYFVVEEDDYMSRIQSLMSQELNYKRLNLEISSSKKFIQNALKKRGK